MTKAFAAMLRLEYKPATQKLLSLQRREQVLEHSANEMSFSSASDGRSASALIKLQ